MLSLPGFAIKKPATTTMFIISMVFFGILGLLKMPIELQPNVNKPTVRIRVTWDGATPSDMDKMITRRIENVLPNVEGITEFTSESAVEESIIYVSFKYGTNVESKITLIQNEINQIRGRFPDDMNEPSIRKSSRSDAPAIVFSMFGGDKTEMRDYAENTLSPMIERIEGVSQVLVFGGQVQQVLIEVDPNKLENYNLGITDVYNTVAAASTNLASGSLREGEKQYIIKVETELKTADEISEIVLSNKDGNMLKLKDVAEVTTTPKERDRIYRKNGVEGINVIVSKTDDGNAVFIVKEVNKILERNKSSFPLNTEATPQFDTSVTILNSIANVRSAAMFGLIFASVILFIFLKSIAATIIIAVAIPISIIFTFYFLSLKGITLNLVSLMGLSLGVGMLVDNSVVVVDNIFRHVSELGKNKVLAAKEGAEEVALPVLASTLTTVAAFMPLLFQEGLAKEQYNNLCYAISFSLIASLLISLTFVPMVSGKIMNEKKNINADGRLLSYLKRIYSVILKFAIRRRGIVLIGLFILFAGSIKVGMGLGRRYIPSMDEGRIAVVAKLPTGSDINKSDRIAKILEEKVQGLDYVKDFNVSGNTTNTILNMNIGLKTSRKESIGQILAKLRKVFVEIPDVELSIVPRFVFGTRGMYDLEYELYSDNENQLREVSGLLKNKMEEIDGIYDVTSSYEGGKPEGRFILDREKAAAYGVSASTIARVMQIQILGGVPFKINSENREIDVTLQLQKKYRESMEYIMDSRITLPNGKNIKISDVASFHPEEGPAKIEKKDKHKKIVLYANLKDGLDLKTAQDEITSALNEIGMPDGLTYGAGGNVSDMEDMNQQVVTAFMIAVFLIYFILVWQFESFILPFIIILSIPLSTTGAFYALKIANMSIDSMAAVGFVMLAGIVVNNAIVLIDFINGRRAAGDNMNKAIVTAGKTRLRPILMTTLTTVLGMLPLMFSNGEGSELYKGMSFVVIFGLSSATLLTLVVIPVFYYVINDIVNGIKNIKNSKNRI